MKDKIFSIARGNSTALVWDEPKEDRLKISKDLLKSVEQVGFINYSAKSLEMMGKELCVNATLATAMLFGVNGELTSSKQTVSLQKQSDKVTAWLRLAIEKPKPNIVLLNGIGYIFTDAPIGKANLASLSERYKLPAFGSIVLTDNKIEPCVYVKDTDSCVDETACGSGSIAAFVLTGQKQIIQPSGGTIFVDKVNGKFQITAEVQELK